MSDVKKYSLSEFVFRDIRADKRYQNLEKKYGTPKDPVGVIDLYNKKSPGTPDAERWEYALESYKQYPFFSYRYELDTKEGLIYYKCSGSCNCSVKITADMLTGPDEIIEHAKSLKLNNRASLKLFCSVAYTVGNCCPVMKNKGGRRGDDGGVDTCWYKLDKYLKPDKKYPDIENAFCKSLSKKGANNDLNTRNADNMFAMFPEPFYRKDIIRNLMLEDYYYPDGKLKISTTPKNFADSGADEYEKFLNDISALIVKRIIRIYYKNDLRGKNIEKLAGNLIREKLKELGNS